MANIKSAEKQARQSLVRRDRNNQVKSTVRTAEKKLRSAVAAKAAEVPELFKAFASSITKAASKGVVHKGTASRKIGRMSKFISTAAK